MSNVVAITRTAPAFNPASLPLHTTDVLVGKTYRAKLKAATVDDLPFAPRGMYVVKAEGVRGLELRVTKESKTFYVRARMGGREDGNNRAKPVRVGTLSELGKWQNMMDAAATVYGEVRKDGRDFNAERAQSRMEFQRITETPAAYWERYKGRTAAHGRGKLRAATVRGYAYALPALLGAYWERPMDALTPAVVSDLFVEARERVGVITARTGLRTLRAMQNYFDLPNTTGKTFKTHADARKKHTERLPRINVEQAPTVAAWLVDYKAQQKAGSALHAHADLMLLAMLLGLRDRPMRAMRWDWLDLHHAIIRVPAEFQKNGLPAELPLSTKAVAILSARKEITGKSPNVFPAARNPEKTMSKTAAFFSGLPWRFSMHDGRKVLGCVLTNHPGVAYTTVKALLTHIDGDVTSIYAKATWSAQREAMEALAGVLLPA